MHVPSAFSGHDQEIDIFADPARMGCDSMAAAACGLGERAPIPVTAVHTSLSGVAFFSLCCSNRSAVQVDSRLHCSDNRHLTNGLGGQHGEEGSYEVEDQVGGEEDGDQDESEVARQEEEVTTVDIRLWRMSMCTSFGPVG
jgi:hypothetical protein